MAEVLITLGIIGVVAALTMPALIAHHKKIETASKLKKFYSMMSQAILLSQNDNDAMENWNMINFVKDDDGNYDYEANGEISKTFFYKYLAPYIKYVKIDNGENFTDEDGNKKGKHPTVYLADGSTFAIQNSGCMDIIFDVNGNRNPNTKGKDIFSFLICPTKTNKRFCYSQNSLLCTYFNSNAGNPDDKSRERLIQDCADLPESCTGLLEHDGWEFKDGYPYKL